MRKLDLSDKPRLAWLQFQLTCLGIGLLVVLVPIAVTGRSLDHAQKVVKDGIKKLDPGIDFLERTEATVAIVALIVLFFWSLGWFLSRTETGGRWLEWASSKYLKKSPLWVKHSKRSQGGEEQAEPGARPALVRVQGTWQPGVVVEEHDTGWCTVFVPHVPALSSGRVYCLPAAETLRLETSLADFRRDLTSSGKGAGDWLRALGENPPGEAVAK
jgi:uncharacterized membrane protein